MYMRQRNGENTDQILKGPPFFVSRDGGLLGSGYSYGAILHLQQRALVHSLRQSRRLAKRHSQRNSLRRALSTVLVHLRN